MRDSVLCHGNHGDNVALERGLDVIEVDVLDFFHHDLLACLSKPSADGLPPGRSTHIVDQDAQLAKLVHVLLDDSLAVFVLHEVDLDNVALAAFLLLDQLLDLFGAREAVSMSRDSTNTTLRTVRTVLPIGVIERFCMQCSPLRFMLSERFLPVEHSTAVACDALLRSKTQPRARLTLPSPASNT